MTAPRAIVIGASAGGVDAIGRLLAALPPDFAPTVVVVLHIRPDLPSALAAVFGARCALPVREAVDKQPMAPGTVFLAPPDYHLLIEDDATLALSRDPAVHFSRPAIDALFESAAVALGARVVGVLLTGASHDGAAGLARIAAAGGTTLVESPDTAVAPHMPRAALAVMTPNLVASLDDLATWLAETSAAWESA